MKTMFICSTLVILALFFPLNSFGQESAYVDKSLVGQIGLGYGLGGSYGDMVVPPLVASVEYNWQKSPKVPLSFGGLVGYAKSEKEITMLTWTWKYTYTYLLIGGRAAYHFTPFVKIKGLDPYAGIIIYYAHVSAEVSEPSGTTGQSARAEESYWRWGLYAGARYYLTEKLGAFFEVGFGFTTAVIGACYKF